MAARGLHGRTMVRVHRYVALVVAIACPASAGLVPGGGPTTSDCYAELDVAGIENGTDAVKRNKKVMCVDGDACDFGPCGDGVCDLRVRVCWNQSDRNVAECNPPATLDKMLLRGPLAAQLVMPHEMSGPGCGEDYTPFAVPTRGIGTRPGRRNVRLAAAAPDGTEPRADFDLIRLVCVPRPFEECPLPTTTTTPDGSTTTSTSTGIEQTTTTVTTSTTSTTRRPPRTTSSTTEPKSTTSSSSSPPPTTSTSSTVVETTLPETSTTSTEAPTTLEPTTTTFVITLPTITLIPGDED